MVYELQARGGPADRGWKGEDDGVPCNGFSFFKRKTGGRVWLV